MIDYAVKNFFTKDECESIIDFCMQNGESFNYNTKENWDCRRVYNENFNQQILKIILDKHKFDSFDVRNINVSMTRYYDGRRLDLHLDTTSNNTIVIPLTENYRDGRFVLSKNLKNLNDADIKLDLKMGEGVIFEGNKTFHGVMPVTEGLRCALNIWLNNTDFTYYKLDKQKKLL